MGSPEPRWGQTFFLSLALLLTTTADHFDLYWSVYHESAGQSETLTRTVSAWLPVTAPTRCQVIPRADRWGGSRDGVRPSFYRSPLC